MAVVFGTKDAQNADLVSAGSQLSPWLSPVLLGSPQRKLGDCRVDPRARARGFQGPLAWKKTPENAGDLQHTSAPPNVPRVLRVADRRIEAAANYSHSLRSIDVPQNRRK